LKTRTAALVIALFGWATASAQTETLYVIEQLVVSVSSTADGSGDRIGQIHSGDRVELLERQGDQAHIRLPSGEEGWVRASYLSAAPPMREQLKARTDELEKLKQEKSKLEADLATARKASTAAAAAASTPAQTTSPNSATVPAATNPGTGAGASSTPAPVDAAPAESTQSNLPSSNPPLFSDEGVMPSRPTWIGALGSALVALVIGFALGWRVLDRRIRAKYGGLRIY
jgi:hypothetical protein